MTEKTISATLLSKCNPGKGEWKNSVISATELDSRRKTLNIKTRPKEQPTDKFVSDIANDEGRHLAEAKAGFDK